MGRLCQDPLGHFKRAGLRLRKAAAKTRAIATFCGKFVFPFHPSSIHSTPSRHRDLSRLSLRYLIKRLQQAFAGDFTNFLSKSRSRYGDWEFGRLARQPLPEAFHGRREWWARDGEVVVGVKKGQYLRLRILFIRVE